MRLLKVAVAGSISHSSAEASISVPVSEKPSNPATRSRRDRPGSVTSEAYMRPGGRFDSLPVRRCAHAPVPGSQSQTSARPLPWGQLLPLSLSQPPTNTVRPRPGSYAMAWPWRWLGVFPVVVRSVQIDCAGSHSQVSFIEMPPAEACSFCIPPNKTARVRLLSQTMAASYRALGAAAGAS